MGRVHGAVLRDLGDRQHILTITTHPFIAPTKQSFRSIEERPWSWFLSDKDVLAQVSTAEKVLKTDQTLKSTSREILDRATCSCPFFLVLAFLSPLPQATHSTTRW